MQKVSVDEWLEEASRESSPDNLGMVVVHKGIVRATSREGRAVEGLILSYDEGRLAQVVRESETKEGIEAVRVWINEGRLEVGDDMMVVLVAGRFRREVITVLDALLSKIKREVVREEELLK